MEDQAPEFGALADRAYSAWLRDAPGAVAVDTETEGFEFFDPPFCVTISWERDEEGIYENHYFELADGGAGFTCAEILMGTPTWIFHNAKFDLQKLILAGVIFREDVTPDRFEDTQLLSSLVDEHRRHGLKVLAADLLGEETDEEQTLKAVRRKLKLRKDDGYHLLPREVVIPYALKDAEFTARLFPLLMQQLKAKGDPDIWNVYHMDKELSLVLLDMEAKGLGVDMDYTEATTKEYGIKAVATEMSIRDMTGVEDFNPQSNPQIRAAFEARGVVRDKYDKHVLKDLDDPLAQAILDLRHVKKLHGTYLLAIQKEQRDGVLHPNFRVNVTKTFRLASGGAQEA